MNSITTEIKKSSNERLTEGASSPENLVPASDGPPEDIEQEYTSRLTTAMKGSESLVVPAAFRPAEASKALEKGDFPLRHRMRIDQGMNGPSMQMLNDYKEKIVKGDVLLILIGPRRVGKTQLATAWAWERCKAEKPPGRYVTRTDLMGELKATWDGVGAENEVVQKYRRTNYLVIDNFNEISVGDGLWETRTLNTLINRRYDDMKATVLIATEAPEKAGSIFSELILEKTEQTGGVIKCNWAKYSSL